MTTRKPPYPICPLCGSPVVGALLTTRAYEDMNEGAIYYDPRDISVYCINADCNYDRLLTELPFPPTVDEKTGKYCSVCGEPQYKTVHGDCCVNGHGGAPSKEEG
jgi:hypothetical protein